MMCMASTASLARSRALLMRLRKIRNCDWINVGVTTQTSVQIRCRPTFTVQTAQLKPPICQNNCISGLQSKCLKSSPEWNGNFASCGCIRLSMRPGMHSLGRTIVVIRDKESHQRGGPAAAACVKSCAPAPRET